MPAHAQPARRHEVRRVVGRRRGAHQAGRPPDRPRARERDATSSSSCPRWATRPTSCSPSRPRSPTSRTPRELDVLLVDRRAPERDPRVDGAPRAGRPGDQPDRPAGRASPPTAATARRASPASTRAASGRSSAADKVVIVAGLPGHERRARSTASTTRRPRATSMPPRSRRSAGAARTPPRSPSRPELRRRPLPDLHRRDGHLHGRPADRRRTPASSPSSATRR